VKRVIERCPNCGVEHDDPKGGECEVCGTQLRYWCRVHGPEIGFMDTAACPRCAAEAARPTPPPRAPAPPPSAAPVPPRPRRPTPTPTRMEADAPPRTVPPPRRPRWGGRDPRVVIIDGAEDLAPYAAAGASFAVRLVRALFTIAGSVLGWGLLGAVGGFFYASTVGGMDPLWTAAFGAMVGGGLGLAIGGLRALLILFGRSRPPG
jgi:hypothetical protein